MVEERLPEAAQTVKQAKDEKATVMVLQRAFAEDYDAEEMMLLAMYIKYLGKRGVNVIVVADDNS